MIAAANVAFVFLATGAFTAIEGVYRKSRLLLWTASGLFLASAFVSWGWG